MKRFLRSARFWLGVILVVQTAVYLVAGANKAYFHMDELYSYGLANYERVQIYETEGFYGNWHEAGYYDKYLTADAGDDWDAVWRNQRDDVHPPVFYGLLRMGMEMAPEFSKWTGILMNVGIAIGVTVMMWLVVGKLVKGEARRAILVAMVALGMASISTVIYIRMYELLTLWILVTTWLHLKLMEAKKGSERKRLLVGIFVVEILGALTQYYYWFYLAAMSVAMGVRWVKRKDWGMLKRYAMVVVGAGLVALAIWPYALQHMFFSNRGEGVVQRLMQPGALLGDLWEYLGVADKYAVHYLLLVAVIGMLVLGARALVRGKKLEWDGERREKYGLILAPVVFYWLIVTAVSPFIELRYVAPVCGLLLVLVAIGVEKMVRLTWKGKAGKRVTIGLVAMFIMMPIIAGVKPDTMYSERAGAMDWAKEKAGTPVLYLTKGEGDWVVLNDLPVMRELGESYVAKNLQEGEVKGVLKGKNWENGLVVIVNDDYGEKDEVVEMVKKAMGAKEAEHVTRMVTSDIYYLE